MTSGRLREEFRRRGLGIGLLAGAASLAALVLLTRDAPRLWETLIGPRAAPMLTLGILLVPASGGALWRRHYPLARVLGLAMVGCLLLAWAVAQWPFIIYPDVSLHATAAPAATLVFLLATFPFGMGLVLPSLWVLFRVFRPGRPRHAPQQPALAPEAGRS
jgi:cytochrome bd ubiquinol oxidase subunit II